MRRLHLVFLLDQVPGVLLRQHLAQIGDIGLGLLRREFAPGDLLAAYAVLPRTVMTYWAQTLGDLVSAARPSSRIGEGSGL